MGFKEYSNSSKQEDVKTKQDRQREEEKLEQIYNNFKDKNEDELLSELFKNVENQKQNGTFNYDGLKNTIDKISPFLTKEQNLKIKEILAKLR